MNKRKLFIVVYLISNISLFAENNDKEMYLEKYFTYSLLGVIQKNPVDFNLGFTLGFESLLGFYGRKNNHLMGIEYRNTFFPYNNNSLQWYYCFVPYIIEDLLSVSFPIWSSLKSFPFGINMIYNFNNNIFSIGPKISYYYNIAFVFFSFDYTYNIAIIDYGKSFHQFAIKAGVTLDGFF